MTRVAAVLCWFDEEPSFLARAVRSAAEAGVSAIVAVDGAYEAFGCERAWSSWEQRDAIYETARAAGIASRVPLVSDPWPTEMAKRSYSFELAQDLGADWLLLLDADFEIQAESLPKLVADVEEDVADVRMLTPDGPVERLRYGPQGETRERLLLRAVPGLSVAGNHYTYVTPSGERLRGNPAQAPLVPAADLSESVTILHWTYHRPPARVGAQFDYYRARDASGVEVGPCVRCGESKASFAVPADLRDLGADGVEWGWAEVCSGCEPAARRDAISVGVRLGVEATTIAGHVQRLPLALT